MLADDHEGVLDRVSSLLRDQFEVVARVGDGTDALESATQLLPDVVVLDLSMPTMDGIHAARELRKRGVRSAIVFLTMQRDPDYLRAAEELGAGYVLKTRMQSDLIAVMSDELQKRALDRSKTT